jgi:hypothetical protein
MLVKHATRSMALSLAVAAVTFAAPHAFAGSPYDGTWIVEVPSRDYLAHVEACPALRFPIEIKDGQVSGVLVPVPSPDAGIIISSGNGDRSAAMTGAVQADGTMTAAWHHVVASGKLESNTGVITFGGTCGPRVAQATRITE